MDDTNSSGGVGPNHSAPASGLLRVHRWLAKLLLHASAFARRPVANEAQHLFALTIAVGMVCGLLAVGFHLAIIAAETLLIERALHAAGWPWMVWTVLTPTLGGVLAGVLLSFVVPGARGSGIPQVKQAFAVEGGRVRVRDAVGKFFIGALQIGSGASLGREGPTVQICAGAASLLARATSLPLRNMRRLTPVGAAAGIAAAFNAPIAAVTFTIEEIVGGLDQAVLSGVVVAAALAAVIERGILGAHPVIEVTQSYGLDHPSSLVFYGVLGLAAALVSIAFTDGLLRLRAWFRGLRVLPAWLHPGIGGLVTGVLAVLVLHYFDSVGVTGGGYQTLSSALAGQISVRVLIVLGVTKLIATIFSYSSGGAGGIFAPSLFVGAMLGGAIGHLDVVILNHDSRQLGAFALVGMGAVFAGVIRAPITSVLIIFEMTGGYGLVLPLMLANATSYMLASRLRPKPIYEALLAQDGVVLPHGAPVAHPLDRLCAEDAMTSELVRADATQSVGEARALAAAQEFAELPVVDAQGGVLGVVSLAQLRAASVQDCRPITALMHAAALIPQDAPLLRAVVSMNELAVHQLLVVDAATETKLVGVLSMTDLLRAHARAAPVAHGAHTSVELARVTQPPQADARALLRPAKLVAASTALGELSGLLREDVTEALLVAHGEREFAVILPEQLAQAVRAGADVAAADIATPAPYVDERAGLAALAHVLASPGIEAAVVLANQGERPLGVITKRALLSSLLEYAQRAAG
ncbi:MAG TPA: chloride channel protein [Polyangiales bacterium]|nr:chloride channel protein [Polyangiales bacterium]